MHGHKDTYKEHAVDVVDIAMFPASIVYVIFGHCNFGAVENRSLSTCEVRMD